MGQGILPTAKQHEREYFPRRQRIVNRHFIILIIDDFPTLGFNIVEFAECRARELVAMSRISRTVSGNNAPQQIIPRHMRRRAASHHIKRLPRRLRKAALREVKQ